MQNAEVGGRTSGGRMTHSDLTARGEIDALEWVVRGKSNKEIAACLSIAEVTAKLHLGRILAKLGVNDRAQAATTALQRGIIQMD